VFFREKEFVELLAQLLSNNPDYSDVDQEVTIGSERRYRADLLVSRESNGGHERLLVECKSSPVAFQNVKDVIAQLKKYRAAYGECQLVFAIPATLDQEAVTSLKDEGIELWDLDFLAAAFSPQLEAAGPGYFRDLLLFRTTRSDLKTEEQKLLDKLKTCRPGRQDWSIYQSLVGDILELLFCPALQRPRTEHFDGTLTNRRDFIFPNYAESGFCAFVRNRYLADYIVVDAKNYSSEISKEEVLQVANYLKPYGTGLFGMILTRYGPGADGCMHTLREQWSQHQKMILVLDDKDVEAMLVAKEEGRSPEEIVGKKLEQFRLSM
jgi:hypothetical protein